MSEKRTLKMDRRQFSKLVSAGALTGLAGCTGGSGNDTDGSGDGSGTDGSTGNDASGDFYDSIEVAVHGGPTTLNPYYEGLNREHLNVQLQFYDHLLSRDQEMKIKPWLAKDWKAVDKNTWNLTLREDVKYHNGDSLNAGRVKGSFELMRNEKYSAGLAGLLDSVSEVNVKSEYELELITDSFDSTLDSSLTTYTLIVHPSVYKDQSEQERASTPVGTGPFKLKNWEKGSKVVFERFDDWWGGTPKIKELTFNIIPEPATRIGALKQGSVQVADNIPPNQTKEVKPAKSVEISSAPTVRIRWLYFNREGTPFEDKRVRQAVNYALDLETIMSEIQQGFGEPVGQGVPSFVFGHNPDIDPYPYDKDKAKSLLSEAGYGNGFDTTIRTDSGSTEICQVTAGYLSEIGINAQVETMEAEAKYSKLLDGEAAPLEYSDWGNWSLFDAAGTYPYVFHSDGRWSYTSDAELDSIIEEAQTTVDTAKREQLWQKAGKRVHDQAHMVYWFAQADIYGKNSQFKEFSARPNNILRLDATKE